MEAALQHLHALLDAAAPRVGPDHFLLPVADAHAVYRERVYCYELYHQLRCLWDGFPFSLGGEVDKAGNPHFADGPYSNSEPDFLVHRPGTMDANLAVLEVKAGTVTLRGIRDDLQKLGWFCREARYFRGILLVFGNGGTDEEMAAKVRRADGVNVDLRSLDCLYHRQCGERPVRLEL